VVNVPEYHRAKGRYGFEDVSKTTGNCAGAFVNAGACATRYSDLKAAVRGHIYG
jgi:hypothetical protein